MDILVVMFVFASTTLGPGLLLLRRWRCSPLERLCSSLGLSLILMYLVGFVGSELGWLPLVSSASCLLGLVCLVLARAELRRLWKSPLVRRAILGYALVLVVISLHLGLYRHYSLAMFSGDWFGHYQRTIFFTTSPKALDFEFLGHYSLPARPPMMNVLAAFMMATVGESFAAFQIAHSLIGSLCFLPAAALAQRFGRRSRLAVWALAALFVLSPALMFHGTYTWTRTQATFFALLGLVLYLRVLAGKGRSHAVGAFVSLAASCLVHYSTGPLTLMLALHYLLGPWRRRPERWRELAAIALLSSALLATWFGWSVRNYGAGITFGSNTTVAETAELGPGENVAKIADNVLRSFVPYPLLGTRFNDPSRVAAGATLRDLALQLYVRNFPLSFGSTGWLIVLLLLVPALWRAPPPATRFWTALLTGVTLIGIAVVGSADEYGLAHICLLPLTILGLALIAGQLHELSRPWRLLLVVGCCIDALLGVGLQARMLMSPDALGMGQVPEFNARSKASAGLEFLGDRLAGGSAVLAAAAIAVSIAMAILLTRAGRRAEH